MDEGKATGALQALAAWAGNWLGPLRLIFVLGALASLAGFALPWFRISRSYRWWYGGWSLLTTNNDPGLWWIGLLILGYAALVLAGYWLLGQGPEGAAGIATLAVGVALGTLVVVALAAADAVAERGRVYRIDMNLGLFLMIPGHAAMIVAALAALIVQVVAQALAALRAGATGGAAPPSPPAPPSA